MDKRMEYAEKSGLLEVVREWIKTEKYIAAWKLQEAFTLDKETADAVFSFLIEEGLIAREPTYHQGNLVIKEMAKLPFKVYIIDLNHEIVSALKKEFNTEGCAEISEDDFTHFVKTHPEVDCIVSPGNSFGLMSGGYDKAIVDCFGPEVEKAVQKRIDESFFGEQPIGTSFSIDIPGASHKLIHTPTMRLPSPIKDPLLVYQCMRTTLMEAVRIKAKSILIPAFGGATGRVRPASLAAMMKQGYVQVAERLETKGSLYGRKGLEKWAKG